MGPSRPFHDTAAVTAPRRVDTTESRWPLTHHLSLCSEDVPCIVRIHGTDSTCHSQKRNNEGKRPRLLKPIDGRAQASYLWRVSKIWEDHSVIQLGCCSLNKSVDTCEHRLAALNVQVHLSPHAGQCLALKQPIPVVKPVHVCGCQFSFWFIFGSS